MKSHCIHCFGGLEFEADAVGATISCPHCGKDIILCERGNPPSRTADQIHGKLACPHCKSAMGFDPGDIGLEIKCSTCGKGFIVPGNEKLTRERRINCPKCATELGFDVSNAGLETKCPSCEGKIILPGISHGIVPIESPRAAIELGETYGQLPPGFEIASVICITGGALGIGYFAFIFETSAPQSNVINIGLLTAQQNGINMSLVAILFGGICMVIARLNTLIDNSKQSKNQKR